MSIANSKSNSTTPDTHLIEIIHNLFELNVIKIPQNKHQNNQPLLMLNILKEHFKSEKATFQTLKVEWFNKFKNIIKIDDELNNYIRRPMFLLEWVKDAFKILQTKKKEASKEAFEILEKMKKEEFKKLETKKQEEFKLFETKKEDEINRLNVNLIRYREYAIRYRKQFVNYKNVFNENTMLKKKEQFAQAALKELKERYKTLEEKAEKHKKIAEKNLTNTLKEGEQNGKDEMEEKYKNMKERYKNMEEEYKRYKNENNNLNNALIEMKAGQRPRRENRKQPTRYR